jgi:hypothetical protein
MSARGFRLGSAAGGLLAAAAVFAPAANANTYEVNTASDGGDGCNVPGDGGDDLCTLRDAVAAANSNPGADTVTFANGLTGPIQLGNSGTLGTGAIDINTGSLDIQGPGADKLSVIAGDNSRLFKIHGFSGADAEVDISGLTLEGGHASAFATGGPTPFGFVVLQDYGHGGAILSYDNPGGDGCSFPEGAIGDNTHGAALTLSGLDVTDNTADAAGGGVAVVPQGVFLGCFEFPDLLSGGGGGASADTGAAPASGELSLTVANSTIDNDDATYDGGEIAMVDPPSNDGGGIAMLPGAGSLSVSNSTVADNTADGAGGGISVDSVAPAREKVLTTVPYDVDNSTIAGNGAGTQGGGIASDTDVGLGSTIVANNTKEVSIDPTVTADSDLASSDAGAYTADHSLIETTDGASVTDGGANVLGIDPQLGSWVDNGGTTPTELPATTSPVIDAGIANSLTADQRGEVRPADRIPTNVADGTDIGAIELPAEAKPIDTTTTTTTPEEPTTTPDQPVVPAPETQLCLGKQVILQKGTDADETIPGSGSDDGILGGGGIDLISGLGGNDCLFGQAGADKLSGDDGDDIVQGDRDEDSVKGDAGDDDVRGQNGNDKVDGGSGSDRVTGGAGEDTIAGGTGDDVVKGDGGNDVIDLGSGKDVLNAGGGSDEIDAADGEKDKIVCGSGKDVAHVDPIDVVDEDCNTVDAGG